MSMVLRVIPLGCEDVFFTMAMDDALLQRSREKSSRNPILRFSCLKEKSVTIGFSQREHALTSSLDSGEVPWTRRLTGGGIVIHDGDLIFSAIFPIEAHPDFRSSRSSYRLIHRLIQSALQSLGKDTFLKTGGCADQNLSPVQMVCFERPICDDLMHEGKKIAGSAQRRSQNYLLHQGSIQVNALSLNPAELQTTVSKSFANNLGWENRTQAITDEERRLGQELKEIKYQNPYWNRYGRIASKEESPLVDGMIKEKERA